MPTFSLDYQSLDNKLNKRVYPLAEVKDRLEKVAFDIVRFRDQDDGANLWQIQEADDGQYIVAVYQEPEGETKTAAWEVVLSKTAQNLNFFYRGEPITKLSFSQLGIPASEINQAIRYLPKRLEENKKLVSALLATLKSENKAQLLAKYPELQ
jgi:hypothetical protein